MRKNAVKNIMKAVVTTTMAATMFIGFGGAAKADYIDDFAAMKGMTVEQLADACLADISLDRELDRYVYEVQGLNYEETTKEGVAELESMGFFSNMPTLESVTVAKNDMLAKVNKDRQKNGSGKLVWDADLEAIARQRAVEVMSNVQTAEFEEARLNGDTEKLNEITHAGYVLKENALVSSTAGISTKTANENWINSDGHHTQRIKAEWTKYACASYTDPLTGMETWVEVFSDGTPLTASSSFDYIRYAADYPDLAAAFGQDSAALYHHYITCGVAEGRTAYQTDGTVIK